MNRSTIEYLTEELDRCRAENEYLKQKVQLLEQATVPGHKKDIVDKLHLLLDQQTFLTEIAQQLHSTDNLPETVNAIISQWGKYIHASSVTIFESSKDDNFISNTFKWYDENIVPSISPFQDLPWQQFPLFRRQLGRERIVCANTFDELPLEIKSIFPYNNHTLILFIGMDRYDKNMGFVNVNCTRSRWTDSERTFIRKVADVLTTAVLRLHLENEITVHSNALHESETRFRTIVQQLSDLIIIVDEKGFIKYISPAGSKILGYTAEEMAGSNIFNYVYPDDLEYTVMEMKKTLLEDPRDNALPDLVCFRAVNARGEIVILEGVGRNAFGNEAINGVILTFKDVTRQRNAEYDLMEAKERAEEADNLKSAFLANMSHEIRTPMNGIIGFASLMQREEISPKVAKYAQIINDNCLVLRQLLDDIIVTSKLDSRQLKMSPGLCNVNRMLADQLILYRELKKKYNKERVEIILDDNGLNETVLVDAVRLQQVLTNLVGNAVKFTDKGFIRFGYLKHDPTHLLFYVKDSGVGIPESHFEIIFERFRQVEGHVDVNTRGTGLGLSISKSLVHMMGGEIWVESQVGVGSEFYFTISLDN